MKQISLSILLCIALSVQLCCQTNKGDLVKEAEEKLKNGKATVSQILADKRYDAVHPETTFRNIIERYCKAETISIATDTIPGKRIKVIGTIKNSEGNPVPGALVYLYHTDSRGWYAADAPHVNMNEGDMRHARLFGYVKTDKDGKFELHTIKPSGYPKSDLPAHIHIHVSANGYSSFVNEFLFDDDERLVGDIRSQAVRNQFMISKAEPADKPFEQKFSYSITLRK